MIALLVTVAFAGKGPPWPTDDATAVDVWVGPDGLPFNVWTTEGGCNAKPLTEPLAQGLRGKAHLVYADTCGENWLLVRYRDGGNDLTSMLRIDQVSREPVKNVWESRPALRSTTVGMDSRPILATPLDDPNWIWPYTLAYGETVDVIDEAARVVRDANGREMIVPAYIFPTVERPDRFPGRPLEERAPRLRFVAGKENAEKVAPIRRVPTSKELVTNAEAWKARPFWLDIEPRWLTPDRRFSADWLDPTGQTLDHTCTEPLRWDAYTPCGRYWLDYTAFGAWWPTEDVDVIGIADGLIERNGEKLPVLRLVVKHPFDSKIGVSPTWDGVDPGALQSKP